MRRQDARRRAQVEELRQRILALTPTESCGHLSFDISGNCMTCAREATRREDMAQAWMEGAFYYGGDIAERWYFDEGGSDHNPYQPEVTP